MSALLIKRAVVLGLLASAALPGAASADPFILPSSTSVSADGNPTITFDASDADHLFFFDHRPLSPETIVVADPDGAPVKVEPVRTRFRTILDLPLTREGTWKVASRNAPIVTGTVKINGEERRVGSMRGPGGPGGGAGGPGGGRGFGQGGAGAPGGAEGGQRGAGAPGQQGPQGEGRGPGAGAAGGGEGGPRRMPMVALQDIPADATDLHLVEVSSTTETFVTAGAPSTGVFKPTGSGLEFEPISHPNTLAADETARFRFLIDGKPAAKVKVTVVRGGDRYRDDVGAIELTTGADGTVAVKWPTAGMYWLGAEAEDNKPAEKRAELRRMSYSATLEVMTP